MRNKITDNRISEAKTLIRLIIGEKPAARLTAIRAIYIIISKNRDGKATICLPPLLASGVLDRAA
jgi:hypothetical protein